MAEGCIYRNNNNTKRTTLKNFNSLKVVPEGFRNMLNKIREEYQNPVVYVTENGYSDRDGLDDYGRLNYYYSYIQQMLLAIKDGCNVKGYAFWSLLDNFEWEKGYT